MATIKFSALVSDVRGTVGGIVFQGNASGSMVRVSSKPVRKNSVATTRQQSNMSNYSQKWRGLTDEERKSWIDARLMFPYKNRTGDTKFYTGFQLFMQTNLNLETAADLSL